MTIGVNFYAFTIANVTSIISNMDNRSAQLNQKLGTLNEYAIKYNLPIETQTKIKIYFTNAEKNFVTGNEWDDLFSELPQALRTDIIQHTHG